MLFGKRVVRTSASAWRLECSDVVTSILGSGGGLKIAGNFCLRNSGESSRFVAEEVVGLEARFGGSGFRFFAADEAGSDASSSASESKPSMLSASPSCSRLSSCPVSSSRRLSFASVPSSSSSTPPPPSVRSAAACSSLLLFASLSTSTTQPSASSSSPKASSSHARFESIVAGTFLACRSARSERSFASSRFLLNRSSRLAINIVSVGAVMYSARSYLVPASLAFLMERKAACLRSLFLGFKPTGIPEDLDAAMLKGSFPCRQELAMLSGGFAVLHMHSQNFGQDEGPAGASFLRAETVPRLEPVRARGVTNVAPSVYIASFPRQPPASSGTQEGNPCMRQLSSVLRANCCSSFRKPFLRAPPGRVYPTQSFATTPAHRRFQLPRQKREAAMAHDMTTLKGKPFDRASLESLMRVRSHTSNRPRLWLWQSSGVAAAMLTIRSAACSTPPPSKSTAACPVCTITGRRAVP